MKFKLLLFGALLLLPTASVALAASPALSLGSVSGSAGQLVTIPISLSSSGSSLAALGIDIGYDLNVLTPTGLAPVSPSTIVRAPAEIGPAGLNASKSVSRASSPPPSIAWAYST
jgi:hypothetical protein